MLKKLLFILALINLNLPYAAYAQSEMEALFNIPIESQQNLPYKAYSYVKDDCAFFEFTIDKGAWIYADSLKVTGTGFNYNLSFNKKSESHSDALGTREVFYDNLQVKVEILQAQADALLTLSYQGCDAQGICYPQSESSVPLPQIESTAQSLTDTPKSEENNTFGFNIDDNVLLALLISFLLGIGLDLTPCVLPMLAIFSAMITGSKSHSLKDSLILNLSYVVGLALTYTVIGFIFANFGLAAQGLLQHPLTLACISALFIFLALDCMELVTLKLPSRFNLYIQNKITSSKRGSISSALSFGMLSALLATPCTSAPLAGALLYVTTQGNLLIGTLLFLCIGLGMGLPLVLVGIFGRGLFNGVGRFSKLIRNLLAIPLFLAAFYMSSHLLGALYPYIKAATLALCLAYALFISLKNLKGVHNQVNILLAIVIFALGFNLSLYMLKPQASMPEGFIAAHNLEDLKICKAKRCLLTFSAAWCANCHSLDDKIYKGPDFKSLSADIVPIRIDVTDQNDPKIQAFINKYHLIGVPTYILTDNSENIIAKHIGLFDLETLKQDLAK